MFSAHEPSQLWSKNLEFGLRNVKTEHACKKEIQSSYDLIINSPQFHKYDQRHDLCGLLATKTFSWVGAATVSTDVGT